MSQTPTEARWDTYVTIQKLADMLTLPDNNRLFTEELATLVRQMELHVDFNPDNPDETARFVAAAVAAAAWSFGYIQKLSVAGYYKGLES